MNSKQRVLTSLEWKEPDRVPLQIYLTPEISQKLREAFPNQDLLEVFGIDFRGVGPRWQGPVKEPHDGVYYDIWGVGYINQQYEFGTYPEAYELSLAQLKTMDDVANYPWPKVDDFDFSHIEQQCEIHKDYAICLGSAGIPDIVNGVSRGRGMEQVLTDIITEDEVGVAIIDTRVNFFYEEIKRGLEAGKGAIDFVCLGEDCGTQKGRLVSPRVFDNFFRPRLQKFIDLAHNYGARAMMHSCGDTHDLMPTFIEMGLDVLDAMQPEPPGMNPEKIREICYGKLAFCGLISTQSTLPHGTVEDCRREARHRLDVIAKGGGYILAPAHCIQPDTPVDNVIAVFEEALGKTLR